VFGKSSGGYGAITHALRHSMFGRPRPVIPVIWASSCVISRSANELHYRRESRNRSWTVDPVDKHRPLSRRPVAEVASLITGANAGPADRGTRYQLATLMVAPVTYRQSIRENSQQTTLTRPATKSVGCGSSGSHRLP